MFEFFAKDPVAYKKKTSEAVERLKYIISKLSDNLINVFRLDSEEGGQDIELTILRAFLNCKHLLSLCSRISRAFFFSLCLIEYNKVIVLNFSFKLVKTNTTRI